jgi:hypothetical protein
VIILARMTCKDVKNLIVGFKLMYPPETNVRHWIIITTEEPRFVFVQPSVSTRLNSFLLERLSNIDRTNIKKFAKDRIKVIEVKSFDINKKRVGCKNVKELLESFKAMYPPEVNKRHRIIITTDEPKSAFIQPTPATRLNSFLLENLSDDDKSDIKDFAKDNGMEPIEFPEFDFDEGE